MGDGDEVVPSLSSIEGMERRNRTRKARVLGLEFSSRKLYMVGK